MTYLDAAYEVLLAAGQPLHTEEITKRALAGKLIAPQGLTPEATMASRLYTDTKLEGSRFVRAGHGRFGLAKWQPKGIDQHAQEINRATRSRLAELLQAMPPDRFEALIGELLIQMGFDESTVTVTKYSGDGGIDVVGTYRAAGLTEVSAAVQVKRKKDNVGAPVVTQLRGSLQVHQQGIIITTSDFSKGARTEAAAPGKTHVGLINGQQLLDLLIKHKVGVVEKTLTVIGLDDEWWGELVQPKGSKAAEPEGDEAAPAKGSAPAGKNAAQKKKKAAPTTKLLGAGGPVDGEGNGYVPTGHKPSGFTLFGQSYTVKDWRELLVKACAVLAAEHGAMFAECVFAVKGRKRQYIAASGAGMIEPRQIPGTDLWVEGNQSATSVLNVIQRLMAALGNEEGVFKVDY